MAAIATKESYKWTPDETRKLIRFRAENEELFLESKYRAKQLWEILVKELRLEDKVTGRQASKKWENLKKKYKDLKTPKNGSVTLVTWQYFEDMDEVLGGRPSSSPSTMPLSSTRSFATDSPSVAEGYRDTKQPSFASQGNRVIEVTGSAELSCPPDRASVTISLQSSKETAQDATDSVLRRLEYIVQTIRQHDVKDKYLTTNKHLTRDGDLFNMQAEVVVVFSDFEMMQQARSVLVEKLDKSVCVGDPYYSLSADKLGLLRHKACLKAMENAKSKAREACSMLRQNLGQPLLVREEESREWTSGQHEVSNFPLLLQQKTSAELFFTSSRMFVTFEMQPRNCDDFL